MKTVLQIAQQVLDELGFPTQSSIVAATDTQRQIKACMVAGAEALRNKRTWPQLKKQGSVTLETDRYQYPLASDYYAALEGTHWDDNKKLRLIGPVSDAEMTERIKRGLSTSPVTFRIFGPDLNPSSTAGQIYVNPTPTASENGVVLSYEYITRNMFVAANYTSFKEAPTVDTDLCLFDDDLMVAELKWRYLRAKKKDYGQEKADADALIEGAAGRWEGTRIGSMAGESRTRRYGPLTPGGWSL